MEDLIKALQIFLKYNDAKYPTSCEHDCLYVHIYPSLVSEEDKKELVTLGFYIDDDLAVFSSFRFGRC